MTEEEFLDRMMKMVEPLDGPQLDRLFKIITRMAQRMIEEAPSEERQLRRILKEAKAQAKKN